MASRFWLSLPQYTGQEMPKWSTGWLDGFKARYNIKRYRNFGEVGAVNQIAIEVELEELREQLRSYSNENIYNMDETGLFWKMTPDSTLATMQTPGGKHEKARITANFCCNVDGSHKLPPWFIGKAAKPRCFGSANIKIKNFNAVWRHNKKGWMTGRIFKEYLIWFDMRMLGRKVILLIDGFSAHYAGKLPTLYNDSY